MGFRVISLDALDVSNRNATVLATGKRVESVLASLGIDDNSKQVARAMLAAKEKCFTLYRTGVEKDSSGADVVWRLSVVVLGEQKSRHMPLQDVFGARKALNAKSFAKDGAFVVALDDDSVEAYEGVVAAILRSKPTYSRKTEKKDGEFDACDGDNAIAIADDLDEASMRRLGAIAEIVPMVAHWVDMPTLELDTEEFAKIARKEAEKLGIRVEEIRGDDLLSRGFGGLYHVGKSGTAAPCLVSLEYRAAKARRRIALVGKGLVYDTGGLCLKPREHMSTMKGDMGGAAAVLGAVLLAAKTGLDCDVTGILCMAENGIGPNALRPDDVITLHSGLTVEINNTDAEGRLVLGDGVSYASSHYSPDLIVDVATLTGAQLMCTGKRHAGLLARSEELESAIVEASRACGEPVFPMLYAPDMLIEEFKSDVADMKNSCKDRMNAQSSCAGHFVEKHLAKEYRGEYAHIDIAGPAWDGERATGYGAVLLDAICRLAKA